MTQFDLSQEELDLIGEALEEYDFQLKNAEDPDEAKVILCSKLMLKFLRDGS